MAERYTQLARTLVQREPGGITPLLEARIIEASALSARRRVIGAAKALQSATIELNQLRGEPVSAIILLAPFTPEFPPYQNISSVLASASEHNFELQARVLELEQQGFRVGLSKNERWPSVKVGPYFSRETANDRQTIVGVGISLPIPLWDQNDGKIATAEARRRQAQTALRLAQLKVEREISERLAAYQAQIVEIHRWGTDPGAKFKEAAELGDRHYRLGAIPVSTYVELQDKYLEALDSIFETEREALENKQELDLLSMADGDSSESISREVK